jgi:hypothetical protein
MGIVKLMGNTTGFPDYRVRIYHPPRNPCFDWHWQGNGVGAFPKKYPKTVMSLKKDFQGKSFFHH